MKTVTYTIPNISCKHCVHTIQSELGELPGVRSVEAEVSTQKATVVFEDPATEEGIVALLREINYAPA